MIQLIRILFELNLLQATTPKPNFNTNSARAPWAPKLRPIKRVHARYAATRSATCNPGGNAGGDPNSKGRIQENRSKGKGRIDTEDQGDQSSRASYSRLEEGRSGCEAPRQMPDCDRGLAPARGVALACKEDSSKKTLNSEQDR